MKDKQKYNKTGGIFLTKLDNDTIVRKVYDDIEIIQFKRLLQYPNLVHG